MPIIDPGTTVVGDDGIPLLSPNAYKYQPQLTKPDIGGADPRLIPPTSQIAAQQPTAAQISPNRTFATDTQKDIYSQMPQRNDPSFQVTGGHKLANHILGILAGIGAGSRGEPIPHAYQDLQDRP